MNDVIDNNNILYIRFGEHGNGSACIFLQNFFPCSQKNFSDLYKKMIKLDYEHYYDILEGLREYFKVRIADCEKDYKENGDWYFKLKRIALDADEKITMAKKDPDSALPKEEMKKLREEYKRNTDRAKNYMKAARKAMSDKKKFEGHLEFVNNILSNDSWYQNVRG